MNNQWELGKRKTAISRIRIVLEQLESFDKKLKDMDDLIASIRREGMKGLEIDVTNYGTTTVNTEALIEILVKQRKQLREQRDFFSENIIRSAELFNSVFVVPVKSDISPDKPDESPDRPDVSPDKADKGE